jgi:nucleotide-binding universal stress UspA family protein
MSFSHILVPVVGNTADDEAIRLAVQVAHRDKAKVLALYVVEVQRNLPLDADTAEQVERGEMILEKADRIAKAAKGGVETEVLQARAAGPAIIDDAVERGVDLIVMGIPYRNPLGDFRMGSTADYVLKHAICPVWLCREPPQVNLKNK